MKVQFMLEHVYTIFKPLFHPPGSKHFGIYFSVPNKFPNKISDCYAYLFGMLHV